MITFTSSQDGSDIDALIRLSTPTSNYGTYVELWVGEPNDDSNAFAMSLIQCDEISTIPSNAIIQTAKLTLLQVADKASNASTFTIYRNTASWAEAGVTWNTQPSHDATVLASKGFTASEANGAKEFVFNADGIAAVQGWVSGVYNNYGVMIMDAASGQSTQYRYASAEDDTAGNRPKWTIEYILANYPKILILN
jgi:hypothetical protein